MVKYYVGIVIALTAVACFFTQCLGCASLKSSGGIEAAYTAALVRCVDKATTITESRACRAEVDRAYGVKDAGP